MPRLWEARRLCLAFLHGARPAAAASFASGKQHLLRTRAHARDPFELPTSTGRAMESAAPWAEGSSGASGNAGNSSLSSNEEPLTRTPTRFFQCRSTRRRLNRLGDPKLFALHNVVCQGQPTRMNGCHVSAFHSPHRRPAWNLSRRATLTVHPFCRLGICRRTRFSMIDNRTSRHHRGKG